jgi:hypothetical protein
MLMAMLPERPDALLLWPRPTWLQFFSITRCPLLAPHFFELDLEVSIHYEKDTPNMPKYLPNLTRYTIPET